MKSKLSSFCHGGFNLSCIPFQVMTLWRCSPEEYTNQLELSTNTDH